MRFPRSKSYSIHIPPILGIFPAITLKACTVLHLSVLSFIYSLSVVRLMSTVGLRLCEMSIRELPDPERREQQVAMVANNVLRALIRRCLETDPQARPTMEEIINEIETEV